MCSVEKTRATVSTCHPPRARPCSAMFAALTLALSVSVIQGCRGRSQPPEGANELADKTPAAQASSKAEDALKAVRSASSVGALAPFVTDANIEVRRAAISRLGELSGPEAVKALGDAFQREPRTAGSGIDAGLRADVVATLGRRGTPDARAALLGIARGWLRDGPKVSGYYAHIHDTQYFAVAVAALRALEPYDDEETRGLLRSVADDSSVFYALREAAWRTSLQQEMARKGLEVPADRAAFLVTLIEPEGVLVEARWTGKKPGQKTNSAAREAALEGMVHELGWPAARPLQALLRDEPAREPRRTLAAARMLADLVLLDIGTSKSKRPEPWHRDAILTATGAMSALPQAALTPETGSRVFGQLVAASEALNDEGVWKALRDLSSKITIPDAWTGDPPNAREIGVVLPSDLVFVREYSRRVRGPQGVLVEAWYLAPVAGADLVSRLERATGKTAVKSERGSGSKKETLWAIELQPAPPEFAGMMTFGITVQERAGGFQQRLLGRTVREGRTLLCARKVLPR